MSPSGHRVESREPAVESPRHRDRSNNGGIHAVTTTTTAAIDHRTNRRPFRVPRLLRTGLGLACLCSIVAVVIVVFGMGGWNYYWTPQDVRAYTDLHPLLRPSGIVGRSLGMAGLTLMILMHLYSLRKRLPGLRGVGSVPFWLEFHIFCGFFGPVLITLHTSFKFNGLISVAYWSMVIVVASGFVGRYLYVRIPRSIRGHELSRAELDQRVGDMGLQSSSLPEGISALVNQFQQRWVPRSEDETTWAGLLFGEVAFRFHLAGLARRLRRTEAGRAFAAEQIGPLARRGLLMRRIVYLTKTKKLFDLWRVYHKPLAVLMAVIVAVHIGIVWYFGYAFGGRS